MGEGILESFGGAIISISAGLLIISTLAKLRNGEPEEPEGGKCLFSVAHVRLRENYN